MYLLYIQDDNTIFLSIILSLDAKYIIPVDKRWKQDKDPKVATVIVYCKVSIEFFAFLAGSCWT
jgi:hypothetical protein